MDRSAGPAARGRKVCFSWRIENFLAFKEIMETRKIFSRCAEAPGFRILWPHIMEVRKIYGGTQDLM